MMYGVIVTDGDSDCEEKDKSEKPSSKERKSSSPTVKPDPDRAPTPQKKDDDANSTDSSPIKEEDIKKEADDLVNGASSDSDKEGDSDVSIPASFCQFVYICFLSFHLCCLLGEFCPFFFLYLQNWH